VVLILLKVTLEMKLFTPSTNAPYIERYKHGYSLKKHLEKRDLQ